MALLRFIPLSLSCLLASAACLAATPAVEGASPAEGGSFDVTIPIVFTMPGMNSAALAAGQQGNSVYGPIPQRPRPCGTPGGGECALASIPPGASGEQLYEMSGHASSRSESLKYLEAAAAKGYSRAQGALGYNLLHGVGMPRDAQRGLALSEQAAAAGQRVSQEDLGEVFEVGLYGIHADPARAIGYFRQAAAQRMAIASFHLGIDYEIGRGVAHNRALALQYLREAASAGQEGAGPTASFLANTRVAQFHSVQELDAAMSPPQHKRTAAECGGEPNYPAGYGGSLNSAHYCQTHPGCPYQVQGMAETCVRPLVEAVPGINY
jgi:hypothetical protein